jgi:tRNA dihydrouridine synthase A
VCVCVCAENFSNYYLCDSGNCGDAESHDGLAVFTYIIPIHNTGLRLDSNNMDSVLSIAPMIQWTDRYWRFLFRHITSRTLLYTEMVMDNAVVYNPTKLEHFLGHDISEHPLALQLGGCDPKRLGEAAYLAQGFANFAEINLNCGCPSNKAKRAGFGAELMLEPQLVGQIVHEMIRMATTTEITVKCRLGVTGRDSWPELVEFMRTVSDSGVRKVVVHARSCVLKGLSPAQNRTIPPLKYGWVHELTKLFPELRIVLNGGVTTFGQAVHHLGCNYSGSFDFSTISANGGTTASSSSVATDCSVQGNDSCGCDEENDLPTAVPSTTAHTASLSLVPDGVDEMWGTVDRGVAGVMMGREAYRNPFLFANADEIFFDDHVAAARNQKQTRRSILVEYLDYASRMQADASYRSNTCNVMKPLHYFFMGSPDNSCQVYKQLLDKSLCDHIKRGVCNIPMEEMVMECVENSIPASFLDAPIGRVEYPR